MKKTDETPLTKEKLYDAALGLILSKGFVGTSVDDICREAKVTKGSFFHYFRSKDELGAELLRKYCENGREKFKNGCCSEEKDPH